MATRPEKREVRIWRVLEAFIGISDLVLSEIVIGDVTALMESLGHTRGLSR